jgi:hypothetical protein
LQRAFTIAVLLGLLLASAGAFALTEHLKLIKSPVYDTKVTRVFSPTCSCATDAAEITFKLRQPDRVRITIVDASGHPVVTAERPKSKTFDWYWYGMSSPESMAPDGVYQPKITLLGAGRTILMPNKITLDTSVPHVLSASDGTGRLMPGDHRTITISYVLDGPAHAAVYLGTSRVVLSRRMGTHAVVKWNGTDRGKPLPPGRYVLDVSAIDRAGNETPAAQRKQVVVDIVGTK